MRLILSSGPAITYRAIPLPRYSPTLPLTRKLPWLDMARDFRHDMIALLQRAMAAIPTMRTPTADRIPQETADRILDAFAPPDEDDATAPQDALPLLARIPSRGHVEDDWSARPTPTHPWPVVLLHGTARDSGDWQELSEDLRADGWAVFAPTYGARATRPLADSARQVGAYMDAVLQVTGAEKLILVGHSQGGTLARYWMRFQGGQGKVHHLVGLGASHHGTRLDSALGRLGVTERWQRRIVDALFGPAGNDQVATSELVADLNAGAELEGDVTYTCIATRYDTVVIPPESGFLHPPDGSERSGVPGGDSGLPRVRNIWVQDLDPMALTSHTALPYALRSRQLVRAALEEVRRHTSPTP